VLPLALDVTDEEDFRTQFETNFWGVYNVSKAVIPQLRAQGDDPPSHLLLGVAAVEMALDYSRRQLAEATAWESVSRSADYAEPYPAEFPPAKLSV